MTESSLWKYIRNGLIGKCHITRIESSAGNGVPDVTLGLPGKTIWIELKYTKEWPKRDTKYYLLHEIQHIIQDIDGLSQGGSTAAIPQYMKNAAQGDKAAIKQQIDDLTKQRSELSGVKNVTKRWSIDYKIDELKNALEMIDNDTARYVYDSLLGEEEAKRTSKQSSMKDEVVS